MLSIVKLMALAAVALGDVEQAQQKYRSGAYADCLRLVEEDLSRGQGSEDAWILKVQALLATGQVGAARTTVETGLERLTTALRLRLVGFHALRQAGDAARAQQLLKEMEQLFSRTPWRFTSAEQLVAMGEAAVLLGLDPKQVLEIFFDRARTQKPDCYDAYRASGMLGLEKHDDQLAAESFRAGLKQFPGDADLHYGLSAALRSTDGKSAARELQAALAANPHHAPSLLAQVDHFVDAEEYALADAAIGKILATNPAHPQAWAFRAVLAHLRGARDQEQAARAKALAHWRTNPEVDHRIGQKLSQKYRFAEGADYQRRALGFDPHYLPAKIQLAQDLLRLGHEAEGWKLAGAVHAQDGYDVAAFNLTTLREAIEKFRTIEDQSFVVRLEAREADVYGPRVLALLHRAKDRLCGKYGLKVDKPVLVEIFAQQSDFAVRTFGMPGGEGYLGVCFGDVITANSPAALRERRTNWEAVLWHEFCHVVTLRLSKNKMPRWLSEGISVYEERQANRSWGQTMNPEYRRMILGGEWTPVGSLSAAFLAPPSGRHLQFAYFQSSLVVEYLIARFGIETLKQVLVDLGADMPVNEALERRTATPIKKLEQDCAAYARQWANELAPPVDFDPAKLPDGTADIRRLAELERQFPNNYYVSLAYARALLAAQRWADAKTPLQRLVALYPGGTEGESPYLLLAQVHRKLGDTKAERAVLEKLAEREADAAEALLRLLELATADGDWRAVLRHAERLLAVDPLLPQPHRALVQAGEQLGESAAALAAARALLHLEPDDVADIHFRLARLLETTDAPAARRHVLRALEEAPRFREAQKLLLRLVEPAAPAQRTGQAPP